nr:hypothetical protein GCM10020093_069330 [Planobispora longispora]
MLAEFVGSMLLVAVVVGSGIMAQTLSPQDVGLQLLENAIATVFGLGVLIVVLGPVSGAHFNPVVSLADWWQGRRTGAGLTARDLAAYLPAQVGGAVAGAVLANAMFAQPAISWAATRRSAGHLWLGELVATAGLVLVVFGLARSGRTAVAPAAVAGYIGAAYWFTSSTSFANPAVTVGRAFSDSFAGIAPASVPAFIAAQLLGGAIGLLLVAACSAARRPGSLRKRSWPIRRGRPAARPALRGEDRRPMSDKPSVLFVCVHDAGRSQMAAAWLAHLARGRIEVRSAGSAPAEAVNPVAVRAMAEVGVDITAERPKVLTNEAVRDSDVVITMGCGDACPFFPGKRYEDWKLDDPAGQGIEAVRPIRDEIRTRVERLIAGLLSS